MEDLEAAVEMLNRYSRTQVGADQNSVDSLKIDWQAPAFNLDTDSLAVFTTQGQLVGYVEFWDIGEPHVRLVGWAAVDPDHWGRGLGKYMVKWVILRARQNIAKAPASARVVLHHFAESHNQGAASLLARCGFQTIRSSYRMRIDFD